MLRTSAALALAVALVAPVPVAAGVYTDDLGKCLVKSTADADQQDLVLWVFAAMSRHPAVTAYAEVSQSQHAALTRRAAELMQRLLVKDCRAEAVAALKYEGEGSLSKAFEVLGQVAFRGLTNNPQVASGMEELTKYVDAAKLGELAIEAGIVGADR